MLWYALALVIGFVLIAKAGDIFVDSACGIARALGVPRAVVALTLVAFATSAPEFFVSVLAAWLGNVGITYGNAVGSCIVNITPILALAAIFGVAVIDRERLHECICMLAIGGMLAAMALNGQVGAIEGLLLLLAFTLFLRFVVRREIRRRRTRKASHQGQGLRHPLAFFALSTAGILIASRLLIFGGVGAALLIGVPEAAIGFTLIAIGTSLPELTTIVISIRKGLPEFSVGTIVGSNIFNVAFVLGLAALIRPLPVDAQTLWFSNPMMLLAMAGLLALMWTGRKLTRGEGFALLALYAVYLVGLALLYKPL
jgi:cation:H+ antiporter